MQSITRANVFKDTSSRRYPQETDLYTAPLKVHDVHCHLLGDYVGDGFHAKDLAKLSEIADVLNIDKIALCPVPTTIIPKQVFNNQSYYIPDGFCGAGLDDYTPELLDDARRQVELIVRHDTDQMTANTVAGQVTAGRFLPMLVGFHLGDPRSIEHLIHKLEAHPGVFYGAGELTIQKEVVEKLYLGTTQANLHHRIGPLVELCKAFGVIGAPVLLHCDIGNPSAAFTASDGKHKIGLDHFFGQIQTTDVIWAHAGGLGRFIRETDNHLSYLEYLLNKHPHLSLDISFPVVARQITSNPAALERWSRFMTDYHDRILFGSDTLTPIVQARRALRGVTNHAELGSRLADIADPLAQTRFMYDPVATVGGTRAENARAGVTRARRDLARKFGGQTCMPIKQVLGMVHTVLAADRWAETETMYRPLFDRIPRDKLKNILSENFERIFTRAEYNMRAFEEHAMPLVRAALREKEPDVPFTSYELFKVRNKAFGDGLRYSHLSQADQSILTAAIARTATLEGHKSRPFAEEAAAYRQPTREDSAYELPEPS